MRNKKARVKEQDPRPAHFGLSTGRALSAVAAMHGGWDFSVHRKLQPLLGQDAQGLIRQAIAIAALPPALDLPPGLEKEQRLFLSGALVQRPFLVVEFNATGLRILPAVAQKAGATPDELLGYCDRSDRLLRLDEAGRIVSQRAADARRLLAGMQREAVRNISAFYVKQLATLQPDSPLRAQYLLDYAQIQVHVQRVRAQAEHSQARNAAAAQELRASVAATEQQTLAEQSLDRLRRGETVDQAGLEAVYQHFSPLVEQPSGAAPAGGSGVAPAAGKPAKDGKGQTGGQRSRC